MGALRSFTTRTRLFSVVIFIRPWTRADYLERDLLFGNIALTWTNCLRRCRVRDSNATIVCARRQICKSSWARIVNAVFGVIAILTISGTLSGCRRGYNARAGASISMCCLRKVVLSSLLVAHCTYWILYI